MNRDSGNDTYRIGVYVRESRDDNGENYETIEIQRDLLIEYIQKNGLGSIYKVYIDDNVSGSVFDRPGILELKRDVESGEIDLVMMKDLSRLGRNNAKTLLFLDYLEEYGVRVLTFDGRYDSLKDNETVGIDTWFNERYIRDISKKIRTNLRYKIQKGEYIGHAPYGYRKSSEQKNRLCIDQSRAPVVREIFSLYREGYGYAYIAKYLNTKGYPPPSERSLSNLWSAVAVKRILGNRVYLGETIQGVSEKVSFKSKKTRKLPEERWIITRDTHPPIIAVDEFEEVQMIRTSKGIKGGSHKGSIHALRDVLFCGRCGSTLHARVRKNRPSGYICSAYGKYGAGRCSSHFIREQTIMEILVEEGNILLKDIEVRTKVLELLKKDFNRGMKINDNLPQLKQQLISKKRQQDAIYLDKLEGKISEELFIRANQNIENYIAQLRNDIKRLENKKESKVDCEILMEKAINKLDKKGLTNQMVKLLVERIDIYDRHDVMEDTDIEKDIPGRIRVWFRF